MGYSYYHTLVLIPKNHTLTLEALKQRLQGRFSRQPDTQIPPKEANTIQLQKDEWCLTIWWEAEVHVLVESQEIATRYLTNPDEQLEAGTSHQRLTISATPDPNMDYFNQFVFVLEVVEEFSGLYIFDPYTGEIYKTGV